jgi:acyl-CoA dehydrogenase
MIYKSPRMKDELHMLSKTARQFVLDEFLPQQTYWRQQRRRDAEALTTACATGPLLTDISQELGGCSRRVAQEAIIDDESPRAEVRFVSLNQSSMAHHILAYESEEQKRNWLPRIAAGELVGAISKTEAVAGPDLQTIKNLAIRDGNEYVIKLGQLVARVAKEPLMGTHK